MVRTQAQQKVTKIAEMKIDATTTRMMHIW